MAGDVICGAVLASTFSPLAGTPTGRFQVKGTTMLPKSIFFVTCLLIAGGAMGQTGQIEIKTPWARATPGHAENGTAYLTIVSPTADRLVAVSSPVAKKVELHTMSMQGDVMKMRPLAAIDIPAGQPVTLRPGGMHIMLLGLTQPLREGQSFPLTLSFDHAGPRQVTVAIEKPGAMGPGGEATGSPMHMQH
jgi:periplasmic copper chaperone A